MTIGPALLDSDTLSELSRGHPLVTERARAYLASNGRLTLSAITVFERLRGYRLALCEGKPLTEHLRSFEALAASSLVLPVDADVASIAATTWAHVGAGTRRHIGDILIAATAAAYGLPLITRNRKHFSPMASVPGVALELLDWTK